MIPIKTAINPKQKQRRPKVTAILALAVGGVMALGPARRAEASWFDPIIFDPWAFTEHVGQVAQLGEQISAAVQQVQNQIQELAHLGGDVAPNEQTIISGLQNQLDGSLYSTPSPENQLDIRYPADMSSVTWAQYQSDETIWTGDQRQALVENRQLENQVYRDMATTRQQVQEIVEASNSAPGETAAIQAHDDLLAVVSGELAKLQALKTARSRLKSERLAEQQSELSYAEAERQRVRADWDSPAPPTETVSDPFQN